MTDIIDDANERAARFTELAITKRKPEGPRPNGRCHYCNASLRPGDSFCDVECRDEWEREQRIRNGQFADGQVKPVEDEDYED